VCVWYVHAGGKWHPKSAAMHSPFMPPRVVINSGSFFAPRMGANKAIVVIIPVHIVYIYTHTWMRCAGSCSFGPTRTPPPPPTHPHRAYMV